MGGLGEPSGGGPTEPVKRSCQSIVTAGISAMFDVNSLCWETGGIDWRRPLDTGPAISDEIGRDVTSADPLMIAMRREYSGLCRSSCCSSKTSLDSVATVLIATSAPDPVSPPDKTSLRKSYQDGTNWISVLNTYYTEPAVWLVRNTGCLVLIPCRLAAGLPAATGVRVKTVG